MAEIDEILAYRLRRIPQRLPWEAPEEAPTQERDIPWYEQPKQWFESGAEKFGEAVSKAPILPEALEFVAPAFTWIHEKLEKPFAAIITSPFSPSLEWKKGESWLEHEKREYDVWKAPTYVKGLAEFAMPLWWLPWFGWAAKGARTMGLGSKAASKMAKEIARGGKAATALKLPSGELLDRALFKSNLFGKFARSTENIPIINRIVKSMGGEAAFAHPTKLDPLNVTRRSLVKTGFINSMRDGIRRLTVPKLQVMGRVDKILRMGSKGIVSNIVDKSGRSQYLYDVLEGAMKNPDNYKFLTRESRKYVDTLGDILDDIYKMARSEGVKAPKGRILHRIVKGKTTELGYEPTEFGSLFEASRVHKFMKEGVEKGVDYGLSVDESISSTVNHYMKAISRKRFEKEVGKMGKTPAQMWEASYPHEHGELAMLKAAEIEAVLNKPERLKELILMKKDYIKKFQSKQVLGERMAKFTAHPVFKNRVFPKEVVKTSEKLLNDQSQDWLRTMANISGTSRMLVAAMDLSAPFIQGLAMLGRNPVAWAKSVKSMLGFAYDPKNFYKYLTDPKVMAIAQERILHGGSAQTFEFFEALKPLQRVISKLPGGKPIAQKGLGQTYGRAETAFTGFGEVARNHMWTALKREGMSPEQLIDLSRTIDRMTGVMSTEALAISRTQQDFENAFVFFAPRYTRSGLSFVSDALKGGMAGAEARKSLGALMGGGLSMYYGACKALGQEPNLNPNSGRFMTIKVGDSHIGVGGIMIAMIRFGYDVGITAAEDPVNLVKPLSEGGINRWDNPFIRFLYSRTAPLTSTFVGTAVEQADYFGEPFEDVGDWANFMRDKITPIAIQGILEDPSIPVGIAEFGGLRAFPKNPWELMDEERDDIAIREFGKPYQDLNNLEQIRVNKFDTVRGLQVQIDEQSVIRGEEVSVGFINRKRERETARQVYEETLHDLQRAYDANAITGFEFKEKMQDAGYGLGATYEHIDKQPEYKETMTKLKEPRDLTGEQVEDVAYAEFMDALYKTDKKGRTAFEDQFGIFQYDKYNAYLESFRAKYGDEIYQYIQERKLERDENLPPLAKEYEIAKEVLKPYWEIGTRVERMFGKHFAQSSRGQRMITKLRKQLRLTDPQIEKYYQLFYVRQ